MHAHQQVIFNSLKFCCIPVEEEEAYWCVYLNSREYITPARCPNGQIVGPEMKYSL